MTRLPDQQPTAPQAGQPTTDDPRIDRIATAFAWALDEATAPPTAYKDPTPVPAIGTTPPVPQPGRPPMSQKAVDLNTTILSTSVLVAALGGAASAILWASGAANPEVVAWIVAGIVAAPAALAVPVLALKGLMNSAKEVVQAAPPVIHQHYTGPITQTNTTVNADSHGLIAITRPELPPAH